MPAAPTTHLLALRVLMGAYRPLPLPRLRWSRPSDHAPLAAEITL